MKETIYTIPINESFEQDCECPFCFLEKKLEKEAVDYALGAAMMEPDYRIISNDKGYCNKHLSMLLAAPNKLSLALVLDTHLQSIIEKLNSQLKTADDLINCKRGMLKKSNPDNEIKKIQNQAKDVQNKCLICDKLDDMLKRYTEVFFYMWKKDDELKQKVLNSKGFCLKHFSHLCNEASSNLKNPNEFISHIYNLELKNLERIKEDIHKFTLKFDYRNKDMEWGTAIDAPVRTVEKLRGYAIPIKEDTN